MFYALHELQRAAWVPLLPWFQASAGFLAWPHDTAFGVPPFNRQIAAGCELLVRLCQCYPKPAFDLVDAPIGGKRVAVTERVVLEKPFCRLLHFERATVRPKPVVLVVAPLSGHHATLLRDTVRVMLPDFDVYLTDWCDARLVLFAAGAFHLDDYVAYMREFLGLLGHDSHVVSVCQSTVPVLAAVSLMASAGEPTPRSMTLMGGPVDARRSPTAVNEFATSMPLAWFASHLIHRVPPPYPGAGRAVYPGFLQHAAFMAMHAGRHLRSHLYYWCDVANGNTEAVAAHRRFYDEYNAMLDMTAEYYLESVQVLFQEFRLARGIWQVRGQHVRPQDIERTALITVEGGRDDICGAGQTRAAHDLCAGIDGARRHHIHAPGCGHYGIFSGRGWSDEIYPRIRDLILRYDSDQLLSRRTA